MAGITDSTGTLLLSYYYDAYGVGYTVAHNEEKAALLAQINPFGYRGYVMDLGTAMYYLQSRYYDPTLGRFINADGYTSTGQGLLGNNMYAYCGNNPVIHLDDSGTRYCAATTVAGESATDRMIACAHQRAITKEQAFRKKYAEELAVLEGRSSTYKGIDVVMINNDLGSFSFGKIFLNSKTTPTVSGIRTLRHEYGHTIQLDRLGVINYSLFVALPSLTGAICSHLGKLDVDYYSLPWEFEADLYGNVPNRTGYEYEVLEWYYIYNTFVYGLTGN